MKVINLFAPPGTGKTATGQILAGMLSIAHYRVELIPEFAKFATFARNTSALSDPVYMFAKQENRLHVLKQAESLDFVIMDGPLPIALLFQPEAYFRSYEALVMEVFKSFDNQNFYLHRSASVPYKHHGRNENESESAQLGTRLKSILSRHEVQAEDFMVTPELPAKLFERITGRPAPLMPE